ncbi:hypothetical protein GQ55_7G239300 [Panicum hallii var. hallii]|uniref:DUF7610 domain-containing protein n=1 Tax=Panicum hallii var. hallii TaxID=1504633 RepID=A0A2T7CYD7_9POAL|nr:hypothetical protein GQ55_7G239300 [Panicum hallii var. hallii]
MDMPPATQGRRANTVVERKLDELCASLDDALSSRRRRGPDAVGRLVAEIKAKTDFLRSLLAAEAECQGGARTEHLAEAEARFAVLKATFDQWARCAAAAPKAEVQEVVGEPEKEADGCESSGSTCSCTDSCQEAVAGDDVEARNEATADGIAGKGHDAGREAAGTRGETASGAVAKKREAMGTRDDVKPKDAAGKKRDAGSEAAAETRRRTVQRRWWRRGAAWCGAAGVVAVVAVGLSVELAAVAHDNVSVYVVPT